MIKYFGTKTQCSAVQLSAILPHLQRPMNPFMPQQWINAWHEFDASADLMPGSKVDLL